MLKLVVVSGPNRGSSYAIGEGETSIGRQGGNEIVLESSKVSKRHCRLVVSNGEVVVRDEGSSNGTFVNGVLIKSREIKSGDRISVGEYVFELAKPQPKTQAPALAGMGGFGSSSLPSNLLKFPPPPGGMPAPAGSFGESNTPGFGETATSGPAAMPKDLKGKLLWTFENRVMPFFYELNFKNEWRMVAMALFGGCVVANLVITIYPMFETNRGIVIKELGKRAQFMARQIVERNTPALAARTESKADLGSIGSEEGIRVAALTDLDSRIIAPSTQYNQHLLMGAEAKFLARASKAFRSGKETGLVQELDETMVAAVEPVKVYNPQSGKNVVIGAAIISLDSSLAVPSMGDMLAAYSETLILTGLVAALVMFILYRLTLKPFQVLNDDIDKVLKGDMGQVTREFKLEELNQLWDVINSALQRISQGDGGGGSAGSHSNPADDFIGPMRTLGQIAPFGVVVLDADRKILYLNPFFEEASGIRFDNAVGQDIPSVARDQAFGAFSNDLFDRSQPGGDGLSEDFEFSGITYKMWAAAFGSMGSGPKGYILAAVRGEG